MFFKIVSLEYLLHFFLVQATIVHTSDKCNIHLVSASSWTWAVQQKLLLTVGSYFLSNNADLYFRNKITKWLPLMRHKLCPVNYFKGADLHKIKSIICNDSVDTFYWKIFQSIFRSEFKPLNYFKYFISTNYYGFLTFNASLRSASSINSIMSRSHNDLIDTISNLTANVSRPGAVLLFKVKPP